MKEMKPKVTRPAPAYSPPQLTVIGSVARLAAAASDLTCGAEQCATCNAEQCVRPAGPYGQPDSSCYPLTLH